MTTIRPRTANGRAVVLLLSLTLGGYQPVESFEARGTVKRRLTFPLQQASGKDGENAALFSVESSALNTTASVSTLFSDQADASSASFGDVVRPKYLSSEGSLESIVTPADSVTPAVDEVEVASQMRRRNLMVAIASIGVALLNYFWQFTHPISPVQLLVGMQDASAPLSVIGQNGKPTVVDFWAPVRFTLYSTILLLFDNEFSSPCTLPTKQWCENCKLMAPTLLQVEEDYKDRVNFVMVNGDKRESWPLIEAFGVDAIPHMAIVSADGDVETALIGPIPKRVLAADLDGEFVSGR